VLPPACEHGTVSVTIRKPSFNIRTLASYEAQGFFKHIAPIVGDLSEHEKELVRLKEDGNYIEFMRRAVQLEKVIVVAGETGSGKTTFMKALMQEMPKDQRIITIEDVPELFLQSHPNHVHLYYPSEAKEEDNAPVTAAALLKSCLRMKPNRILLAELRSGETFDFINVAASGHGGSITSCHASSCGLTFERLALMVLQNRQGRTLPYAVIRRLLYLVVDVVIHVHNDTVGGAGRHITELWYDPMKKRAPAPTD
jgi:type IV secretion system protein VirB11